MRGACLFLAAWLVRIWPISGSLWFDLDSGLNTGCNKKWNAKINITGAMQKYRHIL